MGRKTTYLIIILMGLVVIGFPVAALLLFQPDLLDKSDAAECSTAPNAVPHTHGYGLATTVQDGMKLIFNISAAAPLYEVVDGNLDLCGDLSGEMKHITVDVLDARLNLGERLPVFVDLTVWRGGTDEVVIEASTPAMYSQGHGYHFGDNYKLPGGGDYDWAVMISPVAALRQEGAQTIWLDPVEWRGSFSLDDGGNVLGKTSGLAVVDDFVEGGLHISLSTGAAVPLYEVDGTTVQQASEPDSRYFVVDVTDHTVNYEEKLPGAQVTLSFRQGDQQFDVPLSPVISPVYGFHYGANAALTPGEWSITVTVAGLDFLRHAGAATNLARNPVSATFTYALE